MITKKRCCTVQRGVWHGPGMWMRWLHEVANRYGVWRAASVVLLWGIFWGVLGTAPALALSGGLHDATVRQDSDRSQWRNNSPVRASIAKDKKSSGIPLPESAHNSRAVTVRSMLAANSVALPQGQVDMLGADDWRLKINNAAISSGKMVTLGDIAEPIGKLPPGQWQQLATTELWPSPTEEGKPMQISRSRLSQALRQRLGGDVGGRCLLPTSLVIQRGGLLFTEEDLRNYVVRSLASQLSAMPGQAELTEFRLPEYIFLSHPQQRVQLEVGKLSPGRVPLRFAIQEADGTVIRRVSGLANLVLWVTLPAASRPIAKGENLSPDGVTFIRFNAANLKGIPWDGQGGPWQTTRSLPTGEPILQSDLASQLMVHRGDVVKLVYKRGNVQMETHAEVLNDGEPGATVAVRNLQTKKQVYGVVLDGNTVIIR